MTGQHDVPFVSVIIPAYNEERHIQLCLESVLSLDWPQELIEVIVVDNGSIDATGKIADRILRQGGRGRVLYKPGGTIAAVRNYGCQNGSGEILGFLDADCVVERDWLKIGYQLLQIAQDISCVGFTATPPVAKDTWVERYWYPISSSGKHKGTKEVRWLSSFNLLIRRKYFDQINGFDESLITCEDADLGNRLAEISRLLFSDKTHVKHLGSVKTIRQFVDKEYWRGQNSLRSFLNNRDKTSEILSILIPTGYFLSCTLWLLTALHFLISRHGFVWVTAASSFIFFLPLILAVRARVRTMQGIVSTSCLYALYLLARGAAIVRFRR